MFKEIDAENRGIKINGEYLCNLRFADDIAIFGESAEELQALINEICRESKKIGLIINQEKTIILTNTKHPTPFSLETIPLETVSVFPYL